MSSRRLTRAAAGVRRALAVRFARQRWAIVELHLPTPISTNDGDPRLLISHFDWETRLAPRRSTAVKALLAAGYTMDRPSIRCDEPQRLLEGLQGQVARENERRVTVPLHCDGFLDFDLRFRKRYRHHELAEEEIRRLGLNAGDNCDFGWDEQSDGDVAWWCSVEDLTN